MKVKQNGKMQSFVNFGHALGKRALSMTSRFEFAVVETLRRDLLDGRFCCASPESARSHDRHVGQQRKFMR